MGRIILDDELRSRLHGLSTPLELCDTDGEVVGRYVPDPAYLRRVYDWAKAEFAREEAEEAARGVVRKWDGTNGKTTAEAIAHLERLGREHAEKKAAGE